MQFKLKFLFLPLITTALFLGLNLRAEESESDETEEDSSYSLNLDGQAANFVWTTEQCQYNPDHPYCKVSAEIPAYPVYGMGYGWNWPYGSYYSGGSTYRRTGNPDRRDNNRGK